MRERCSAVTQYPLDPHVVTRTLCWNAVPFLFVCKNQSCEEVALGLVVSLPNRVNLS